MSVLQAGIELLRTGQYQAAASFFVDATTATPDDARAAFFLGESRRKLGEYQDAVQCYERARTLGLAHPHLFVSLGLALRATGRRDEAARSYEAALALDPGFVEALVNLGNLYHERGDLAEAIQFYETALRHSGNRVQIVEQLGRLYRKAGRRAEACLCFGTAAELRPNTAGPLTEWGLELHESGRLDEAADVFERAWTLDPSDVTILNGRGINALARGDYTTALSCLRRCVDLMPDAPIAHFHHGVVLRALRATEEARTALEQGLSLCSGTDDVADSIRRELGFLDLETGALGRGWDRYEARNASQAGVDFERFSKRAWQGQRLARARLWLVREQGIGDEIWFAGLLGEVLSRTSRVTVLCSERLLAAFTRSFPTATFIGVPEKPDSWRDVLPMLKTGDRCLMLGSLPRLLRRELTDFPAPTPYLLPDPERVRHWRSRLAALGTGPCIGLAWRGGTPGTSGAVRSIALAQWRDVLPAGPRYVSLQYLDSAAEIAEFRAAGGVHIHDWLYELQSFDDQLALVAALDRVVSVQTAIVHAAGALGVPTQVLLPQALTNWRWIAHGRQTRWYAATELLTQHAAGDWTPVFSEVAQTLRHACTAAPVAV